MSYAALMVYVEDNSDKRIRLAVDLAARFQARLIGIAARASMPVMVGEDAAIDAMLLEQEEARVGAFLDKAGALFRAVTGKGSTPVEWRCASDHPNHFVARETRSADLFIVGAPAGSDDRGLDVGRLLLNAGRPVLVVPEGLASLHARRCVVAWKDTREARRAVSDALPLLQTAENVFLVEVCEWGAEAQALQRLKAVAGFLADHRIANVTERVLPEAAIAGDVLLRFAQSERADLLISGAYGHSRLGEWIFGGVTRELLANESVCCLFSH